jgi:AcrR family transcriptional regulator
MSRTANQQRPEELRRAIVDYLLEHGLANLSLRPLAKAVGSSPRVLLYYFGSKERLVTNVLADIRREQVTILGEDTTRTFAEGCALAWKRMSASDWEPFFRLFFEAYGIALRSPRRYKSFLQVTVEDWLELISRPLVDTGYTPEDARAFATVVLGGLRGFMLDYSNTRDRKRLDRAVALWAGGLDQMLEQCRRRK